MACVCDIFMLRKPKCSHAMQTYCFVRTTYIDMFACYANLNVRIRCEPTLLCGLLKPQNTLLSLNFYVFRFRESVLPIVTHHQLLTGRNTYTTQYETFVHFFIGQRIIYFHRHRTFYHFTFTRTTYTSFTGIR
jgi:hypothetical protein